MKMKYQKPYLAVESFQLNAAIAGTCGGQGMQALAHGVDTCTYKDGKGNDYSIDFFGIACEAAGGADVTRYKQEDEVCYQRFSQTELTATLLVS